VFITTGGPDLYTVGLLRVHLFDSPQYHTTRHRSMHLACHNYSTCHLTLYSTATSTRAQSFTRPKNLLARSTSTPNSTNSCVLRALPENSGLRAYGLAGHSAGSTGQFLGRPYRPPIP